MVNARTDRWVVWDENAVKTRGHTLFVFMGWGFPAEFLKWVGLGFRADTVVLGPGLGAPRAVGTLSSVAPGASLLCMYRVCVCGVPPSHRVLVVRVVSSADGQVSSG